jgi:hypothetical protein
VLEEREVMGTLLLRHATVLVTMDSDRREIHDGAMFARDGWIEQVGKTEDLPDTADEIVDLKDHVVVPGLINTHHHLYQTLTRAVPGTQDAELFTWLTTLYPIWARMSPEDINVSARLGLTELAMSGCTTTSDHLYLLPNGARLDDEIEAARTVGLRFHAARGSMSLGESDGGLPPDSVVEDEQAILDDTRRVIEQYHDPTPGALLRVVVAPCSPFSVTSSLMRESATLARHYGVSLHTHLAETKDEEVFCIQRFGMAPVDYAESVGWLGPDVWFAHAVHIDEAETERTAPPPTCVWDPASPLLRGIWRQGFASVWASTVPRRTTATTSSVRRASPCCSRECCTASGPSWRCARPWRSRRSVVPPCWEETTSVRSRPARPPTSRRSISRGSSTPDLRIRSPPSSCARRLEPPTRTSMAGPS